MIPFNKPFLTGNEIEYIIRAINSGHISGNGEFTKKCHTYFEDKYNFKKVLLTTSCTDALEMCAILADIKPGDEVIVPSYTFVSTALTFVRQGAKIVFADSRFDHPNIDVDSLAMLITNKTKAIVPVHYSGIACDMDKIMKLADKYNLLVIEDAAQAIDSYYNKMPLGSIGHLSAFSFHETKNINCGEGGLLVINDEQFINRSEIIWEKGTDRARFFRGEIDKYSWVDIGSSFLPSEILAAYLFAQLENLEDIQKRRIEIWNQYYSGLRNWANINNIRLPFIPDYATNNGHSFYLICKNIDQRNNLLNYLKDKGIHAVFHYLSLHKSEYYKEQYFGKDLVNADHFSDCLLRLPLYYKLKACDVNNICNTLLNAKI